MNRLLMLFVFVFGLKISAAQKLGIGTITPLMKLHVSSSSDSVVLFENTQSLAAGTTTGIYFKTGSGTTPWTGAIKTIGQGTSTARMGLFTQASSSVTGLIERVSILDNGNVGIGTTQPDSNLTVSGSVHITGNTILTGNPNLRLEVLGTVKTGSLQITSGASTGKFLVSDASGNGTWTSLSPGCGLAMGQVYQGGFIFYLDGSGCHGLVAAPTDQNPGIQWYNGSALSTTAFANGVSMGPGNTNLIVYNQGAGGYAAKICYDLSLGGYDDWYLPSKYELDLMYRNIGPGAGAPNTNIAGFANSNYWSSTEKDANNAWYQFFFFGSQSAGNKSAANNVRAIRAF